MFDRGLRHNPLSQRYQKYMDHRPILPEDSTVSFGFRKLHDPYSNIFFHFKVGNTDKILLSNNIPVEDRERIKKFMKYSEICTKNLNVVSFMLTTFTAGGFIHLFPIKLIYLKVALFFSLYKVNKYLISGYFEENKHHVFSYYYHKYKHTAVDKLSDIEDARRKFFRPDTSVYYRETPQEIYDKKSPEMLHDPAIYYGPHPFNDYENLDALVEINNKFLHGHSAYDSEGSETLLGEPIDIKRKIRNIPTVDEYKNL